MKLYISNRKRNGVFERAMTVYTDRGRLLYTDSGRIVDPKDQKFIKNLLAIEWGIKQFRTIARQGIVSEEEPLKIFIDSKTVYDWIEKEKCPNMYAEVYCNILMELSLLVNPAEVEYSEKTKVLYKSSQSGIQSLDSLMKEFEGLPD